jgi:hypothetical protein
MTVIDSPILSRNKRPPWRFGQLRLEESLAPRTVEKHLIAIRVPNGGKFRRPRSVKAEIYPAWLAASQKHPLSYQKRPLLELKMSTNRGVDIVPKILNALTPLKTVQHYGVVSP